MDNNNSYEDEQNRGCFKVPHKIYGNLYITYSEKSSLTVLWNVYQIFVYDDRIFESPKVFIPEFNISNVIVCNNYLICLDDNDNIHITPLKFKHSAQKRLKSSFQPREQGVMCIENFNENAICIKHTSFNYYLCMYKVSTNFILESEHKIMFDTLSLTNLEAKPWIFHAYSTTSSEYDRIKDYYQQKETWKDHVIVVFSIDRKNVFSVLYSSKNSNENLIPIKLYTCPSEIADAYYVVKTNNIHFILGLTIGTLIKISLTNPKNDAKIIHLNAAISKIISIEDGEVYTDGNALWKSEETFTNAIKFKKCSVAQVKDFVVITNKILCTTFSNLVYLLSINTMLFEELPLDIYCPASKVLSNDDCLAKIMKEITKSNEIVKKIKEEERYLTILSLANRYDILDEVIVYKVDVYETFGDVPKEDLTLVENIEKYYSKDTLCFLLNVNIKPFSKFVELLSNMFGNLMIHIAVSTRTNCIKTLSINIEGQLKKANLAVPVCTKKTDLNRVSIEIKLISSITEVFNSTQNMWTVLYSKRFYLNSEHFIKTQANNIYSEVEGELVDPLYQVAVSHYGHLYKFNREKRKTIEWLLYAKLAENYQDIFNNKIYLHSHLSTRKADIILKQITSDEFLKSKCEVVFEIGEDKVRLEIINDGFCKPTLKIRCTNVEKSYHIRNFLSQMVNRNFNDFEVNKEFVDHELYSTIEKFQRILQEINNRPHSNTEFMKIFEKYQRSVIGKLPI
ncbi:uncharacterized protein LOC121729735 [Aricia agestis]|uniref:uncharacterized protein LOC121729735 n=1 Tax=Aricia agestis TaxID=91739 RepID=UPI001C20BACD|nr:uncharacterized protein LOC121729735 [Aricia agestis]